MLKAKSEPHPEPDQPMVGRCMACGTEVRCPRRECSARSDPAMGELPCVECPKTIKTNDPDGLGPIAMKCGRRIYMKAVQE